MAGLSTVDWFGLVVPFAVFLTMLIVYYVWEGRRERRVRERFANETGQAEGDDG